MIRSTQKFDFQVATSLTGESQFRPHRAEVIVESKDTGASGFMGFDPAELGEIATWIRDNLDTALVIAEDNPDYTLNQVLAKQRTSLILKYPNGVPATAGRVMYFLAEMLFKGIREILPALPLTAVRVETEGATRPIEGFSIAEYRPVAA